MLLFVFVSFVLPLYSSSSTFNRFRRQANGCGPANLNIDSFLREIGEDILIVCCNEHDLCYDTCGQKQLTCDTTFLHCMIQACQQLLPLSNINRCQTDARILFWIVFVSGRFAYQQAQQQHQCTTQKPMENKIIFELVTKQQIGNNRIFTKDYFINVNKTL